MHLNNMLGEEDLNPFGYHRHEPETRVPSMMSPTVVLRDGRAEVGLGSAGSNRIRSAILQCMLAIVDSGMTAEEAVGAPACTRRARRSTPSPAWTTPPSTSWSGSGWIVRRWTERNLFFGGVQAVARNPETGELSGGGDPRRGGAVAVAG